MNAYNRLTCALEILATAEKIEAKRKKAVVEDDAETEVLEVKAPPKKRRKKRVVPTGHKAAAVHKPAAKPAHKPAAKPKHAHTKPVGEGDINKKLDALRSGLPKKEEPKAEPPKDMTPLNKMIDHMRNVQKNAKSK